MLAMPASGPALDLSVIIPTFNRSDEVLGAISSVLQQSCQPREIIVVDDGSTDATAEAICVRWPAQAHRIDVRDASLDSPYGEVELAPGSLSLKPSPHEGPDDGDGDGGTPIIVLEQANRGVSAARNRGIRFARSQWIAFLDSDDRWLPKKLERQWPATTGEYELIHCDEIWIRRGVRVNPMKKHKKRGGHIYEACLPLCCISPSAVMLHRRAFHRLGGFDTGLPACEDYDLWLRFCAESPVHFVDEALLEKYGGHEDQLSQRYWGMDRFRVRALEKMLSADVLNSEQRQATESVLRKKLEILRNGARKRGKEQAALEWQAQLDGHGWTAQP